MRLVLLKGMKTGRRYVCPKKCKAHRENYYIFGLPVFFFSVVYMEACYFPKDSVKLFPILHSIEENIDIFHSQNFFRTQFFFLLCQDIKFPCIYMTNGSGEFLNCRRVSLVDVRHLSRNLKCCSRRLEIL